MSRTTTTKALSPYIRVATVGQNEASHGVEIERWLATASTPRR
jgi:hypothetical protein